MNNIDMLIYFIDKVIDDMEKYDSKQLEQPMSLETFLIFIKGMSAMLKYKNENKIY